MKFAYIDESGDTGQGDIFVMSGLLVDAYKLRKCTAEFDSKLKVLRGQHPSAPNDFKASKLINGIGGWKKISPDIRKKFFTDIVDQTVAVGRVYAVVISFTAFKSAVKSANNLPKGQDNYWVASSLYISALIQKKVQKEKNSKGLTVLIFDDNKNIGYTYLSPEQALQERGGRTSNVLLEKVLCSQLKKLNRIQYKGGDYHFSEANIQEAIQKLKNIKYSGLQKNNEAVYDLMTLGTLLGQTVEGSSRSFDLNCVIHRDSFN